MTAQDFCDKLQIEVNFMIIRVTESLRKTIHDLRKEKGLRGDDISKAVGKSPSFLSRIENGKTITIDYNILIAIFKEILKKDEKEIQEFIELFIDIHPANNSDLIITNIDLSEKEEALINRFYRCISSNKNSVNFLECVLSAIELSSDNTESDFNDFFVASLTTIMQKWKKREEKERQEFEELKKQISDYDDLY